MQCQGGCGFHGAEDETMSKWIYFFGGGQADGDGAQKELLGGKGAGLH